MGVPYFKIQDLVRQHQIRVFSSNYALYGDLSRRVMSTLGYFSSEVEVYSFA
jgi:DNA polymerase V